MTTTPLLTPEGLEFVTEYHLATLSTLTTSGAPHVVPVGFTFDAEGDGGRGAVRIITNGPSQKVLNVRRDGRAAVSQVEGARWLTLSGNARILDDAASVQEGVDRYAARYRQPRENPERVVILISDLTAMGSAAFLTRTR
ncbi:TIGR03618 family F420-dependent PPOX class oxidoreductase [Herbiconiux sp.]|uniref:pyridoxamine 5'-phosphate oxidase family protein n=1 Tax=Herbiconiux sp. TaxID=1871186 RepID=UPI0025BD3AD1|nr:TIGR03618 family F420-dependent PPOX class oxidoreductase [Herbiconiux sp.]